MASRRESLRAQTSGRSLSQQNKEKSPQASKNGEESQDFLPPLTFKGQKLSREVEQLTNQGSIEHPPTRLRSFPAGSFGQKFGQELTSGISPSQRGHIPVGRSQGYRRQQIIRQSARLQALQQLHEQSIPKSNHIRELQATPSVPTSKISLSRRLRQHSQILHNPPEPHRKRKREQEAGHSSPQDRGLLPSKRPRLLSPSYTAEGGLEKRTKSDFKKNAIPLDTWVRSKSLPSDSIEQDSEIGEDFEDDSWLEENMEQSTPVVQYMEINGTGYPRPLKKVPSLSRKQSDTSLSGSGDQKKREGKGAPYRDIRYNTLLAAKGSYMCEFDDDTPKKIRDLCQTLLERDQAIPRDSLFSDNLFKKTCRKIEDRNEAIIIQDVTRLLIPSAQNLAIYGATHLEKLIESVNEGWSGSIPVEGPRPQPDYSVGFRRSAFTNEQLNRLDPLIGSVYDTSYFVATYRMYFPFLTCEVKCGAAALDIADRQNAHSMTIAVRAVVELFRLAKREKELHRTILAFSASHDHATVRIYGHYPVVIDGKKTTFYRHPIRKFDFTELDGKEKWSAHKFTKNVYDIWMPAHLKRICSVIDQLPPNLDFEVSHDGSDQL